MASRKRVNCEQDGIGVPRQRNMMIAAGSPFTRAPVCHAALAGTRPPRRHHVRMLTGHQQYSTRNQAQTIREYADRRGIRIVKPYSDDAKSGLITGGRTALQQMTADVCESACKSGPPAL